MQCPICNHYNPDDQVRCLRCGEPIPVSQINPQAYQHPPPEPPPAQNTTAPGPSEMQAFPPEMMPPSPGMQPLPPQMPSPVAPGMAYAPGENQPPTGYAPAYGGGIVGTDIFDIPEAGRSGMNEILLGPEGINEAPLFTCGFLAAILTIVTLVVLLPFKGSQIYAIDVLINRGFWPYAMIYNFWLGLAMIVWKYIGVQMMKGALKKPLIPPQMKIIHPSNADKLLQNIKSLFTNPRSNPLVYRLWMALLIFRQTSLVERVDAYCSQQSDVEGGNMDASYQIINFCLWSEPIFGFLGTVQGLGYALAGFGNIAGTAMEIDTIKGALASVTSGLSTAFDTTLLGLLNSVILMIFITLLKKDEDGFLANVDVWIKENLMSRLKAPPVNLEAEDEMGGSSQSGRLKRIIEETFQGYMQSLESAFDGWKEGFVGILNKLSGEAGNMTEQFNAVEPLVTDFRAAMNDFSERVEQTSEHQKGLVERVDSHFAKLDPLITNFKETAENLNQERQQLDRQVKDWGKNFDEVSKNMAQQLQEAGKQFLTQADQYQKQANKNTTEMSAVVGQKLMESGQGILAQFQQHIKDQEIQIQSRADSLSKLTESLTQNMTEMGESLQKKFESQTSGMEILQKNFSTYIGQLDGFARQFQNEMQKFTESQMKEIENLSAKSTDTLKAQLTDWFQNFTQEQGTFSSNLANTFADNFNKVSQNVMGQFSQYSQKQDNNISKIIQDIKGLQESFGNLTNQLGAAFNQISQDMGVAFGQNLQKSAELIEKIQSMSKDVTTSSGQSVQALSIVSTQLSALIDQQKEVNQLFNQQAAGLSSSEEVQKRGVEELQKLIVDQQQLIQALNEGTKSHSGNNSGVKEVLDNINAGIESIKPSLTDLVEFLKNKNEPGKGSFEF